MYEKKADEARDNTEDWENSPAWVLDHKSNVVVYNNEYTCDKPNESFIEVNNLNDDETDKERDKLGLCWAKLR